MNKHDDNEREARRQQLADEQASAHDPGENASVDAYHLVRHAVRRAPMPDIPGDFAMEMEALTRDHAEEAAFEKWLERILVFGAAGGLVAASAYGLAAALDVLNDAAPAMPWGLLTTAAAATLLMGGIERYFTK